VPRIPHLAFDEMEVVEQPFRCRGDELAPVDVIGEYPVCLAQHAGVVVQTGEERVGLATRIPGHREAGGKRLGSLLKALDTQQFGSEGLLDFAAAAAPEATEPGIHGISQCNL
jgi:hypothetical protein